MKAALHSLILPLHRRVLLVLSWIMLAASIVLCWISDAWYVIPLWLLCSWICTIAGLRAGAANPQVESPSRALTGILFIMASLVILGAVFSIVAPRQWGVVWHPMEWLLNGNHLGNPTILRTLATISCLIVILVDYRRIKWSNN